MSAIRDDILAGLRASEGSTVGDATPEQILDAYRAEVIRDAANLAEATNPDRSAEFSEGVDWTLDALRHMAAAIGGGDR